jgi:hypothetical protein
LQWIATDLKKCPMIAMFKRDLSAPRASSTIVSKKDIETILIT